MERTQRLLNPADGTSFAQGQVVLHGVWFQGHPQHRPLLRFGIGDELGKGLDDCLEARGGVVVWGIGREKRRDASISG